LVTYSQTTGLGLEPIAPGFGHATILTPIKGITQRRILMATGHGGEAGTNGLPGSRL
jgi:hypothetical protein